MDLPATSKIVAGLAMQFNNILFIISKVIPFADLYVSVHLYSIYQTAW